MSVSFERNFLSFSVPKACLGIIAGILCVEFWPTLLPIESLAPSLLVLFGLILLIIISTSGRHLRYLAALLISGYIGILATHFEIYRQPHEMLQTSGSYQLTALVKIAEWRDDGRIRAVLKPIEPPAELENIGLVRLTMHLETMPQSGEILDISARLFPLSGPFLPGMTDYGRIAYFRGIGASGFSYSVNKVMQNTENTSLSQNIERQRSAYSRYFMRHFEPPVGAVASSLYIGKRDQLPAEIYRFFQKSGLAHLLAISGLHMALFCMSLYGLLRFIILPLENYLPISAHKIGAGLAVLAGFGYLVIAGMPVSAMRAWGIATIILVAVMVDRRALTIRTLALVAIMLLLWRPSFLFQPAFQLSFAATFAIIALHQAIQIRLPNNGVSGYFLSLMLSSLAAGIITTPFIAYHFALFTPWSLLSNLFAVPLLAFLMPIGLIAVLENIVGLSGLFSTIYETGVLALIGIARFFSGLPAAGIWVKPPETSLLFLWFVGLCFITINKYIARAVGLSLICLFGGLWLYVQVPDIFQINVQNEPIIIVKDDDMIMSSKPLSPFWRSIIHRQVGDKLVESCDDNSCNLRIRGQEITLIARQKGLTKACKLYGQVSLSVFTPKYTCHEEGNIIFMAPTKSSTAFYLQSPQDVLNTDGLIMTRQAPSLEAKTIRYVDRPWRLRSHERDAH